MARSGPIAGERSVHDGPARRAVSYIPILWPFATRLGRSGHPPLNRAGPRAAEPHARSVPAASYDAWQASFRGAHGSRWRCLPRARRAPISCLKLASGRSKRSAPARSRGARATGAFREAATDRRSPSSSFSRRSLGCALLLRRTPCGYARRLRAGVLPAPRIPSPAVYQPGAAGLTGTTGRIL